MNEPIKKGDVEEAHEVAKEGEKWYVPHHGVYHSKKPEKLCMVFHFEDTKVQVLMITYYQAQIC